MARMKIALAFAAAFVAAAPLCAAEGTAAASTKSAKATSSALAAARAKITQLIEDPSLLPDVMKSLDPEEQVTFLSELNAAIASMPGSESERISAFVAVNNAALSGAQKGNALALVAEVFATVPPYALPAMCESLSAGLMNRAADKSLTFTDEQYVKICQMVMEKVNGRVSGESNSGVRSGFAAIMLMRASNSESKEIIDAVVAAMPEAVRDDAKTEWFPAALGKGGEKSYDAILAAVEGEDSSKGSDIADSDVAEQDDKLLGIRVSSAQNVEGLIADIAGSSTDPLLIAALTNPVVDALQNPLNYQLPNIGAGDASSDTATIIDRVRKEIERTGYQFQTTGGY